MIPLIMTEAITKFNEVIGKTENNSTYKKPVAFLYTNRNVCENDVKKLISSVMTIKIKYLAINLSKNVKDLYMKASTKFQRGKIP